MRSLSFLSAGALALALAGCGTMEIGGHEIDFDTLGKAASALRGGTKDISESEEYYIGRAVAAQILGRYKPLDDGKLNLYAQKVAEGVAMASERPEIYKGYHVQVLDTDEVNAFAAPGGFIFVTKGLLKLVRSEDELACVLAHEVAHVAKKHGLKTIQTARLTQAFTLLGGEVSRNYTPEQVKQLTESFQGAVDDVVNKLVVNGYSRDKEYEADKFGAQYAKNANYDPGALKDFLARLGSAHGTGGLFKTHPDARKRIDELGSLAASPDYRKPPARARRFSAAVAL